MHSSLTVTPEEAILNYFGCGTKDVFYPTKTKRSTLFAFSWAICLTEKENGVKMQRRLRKTVGLCPALDCIYSSGVDRQIEGSVELCQGLPIRPHQAWSLRGQGLSRPICLSAHRSSTKVGPHLRTLANVLPAEDQVLHPPRSLR